MFKVGSRVKYIGKPKSSFAKYYPPFGTFGTVTFVTKDNVQASVEWDVKLKIAALCPTQDLIGEDDELTLSKLKNGDVVKHNNGEVGIVIVDVDAIIYKNGSMGLRNYRENLTCIVNSAFDIVAVKRPSSSLSCQFNAFDNALGQLVYEREKKVEEMTLAEVCKFLGKEIKIIK